MTVIIEVQKCPNMCITGFSQWLLNSLTGKQSDIKADGSLMKDFFNCFSGVDVECKLLDEHSPSQTSSNSPDMLYKFMGVHSIHAKLIVSKLSVLENLFQNL